MTEFNYRHWTFTSEPLPGLGNRGKQHYYASFTNPDTGKKSSIVIINSYVAEEWTEDDFRHYADIGYSGSEEDVDRLCSPVSLEELRGMSTGEGLITRGITKGGGLLTRIMRKIF